MLLGMESETLEWCEIGRQPIRDDEPTGDLNRNIPEYVEIRAELGKEQTVSRSESVNWSRVVELGREILSNKAKDVLIASYMIVGLTETKGFVGMISGLCCLEEMLKNYPAVGSLQGRLRAIEWLGGRVDAFVETIVFDEVQKTTVQVCLEQIPSLEKILVVCLEMEEGEEIPWLQRLRRKLKAYTHEKEDSKPNSSPQSFEQEKRLTTTQVSTKKQFSLTLPTNESIETAEQAKRAIKDATVQIRRSANFLRKNDYTSSYPYRINRILGWAKFDEVPFHESGKTQIPSPPPYLLTEIQTQIRNGDWLELIQCVESQLNEMPWWLDLNRWTSQALTNLGKPYQPASQAVLEETLNFVRRFPELPNLCFSDGKPFADPETYEWAQFWGKNISNNSFSTPSQPTAIVKNGVMPKRLIGIQKRVQNLISKDKAKDGLQLLEKACQRFPSLQERFMARLELAKLCLEQGHLRAAFAQLQMLDDQIKSFRLEEWEPEISLEVLSLHLSTMKRLEQRSKEAMLDGENSIDALFHRICKLNVLTAVDMVEK